MRGGRVRLAVFGAAALALVAAAGVVGYRVLAPAETLSPPTQAYPAQPTTADAGTRYGALAAVPLILDRRLRVFAEQRRVWADIPVTANRLQTPFWAYRRWPAELVGVAGVDRPGQPPMVVTVWSDGAVVALDGAHGRIAWRAHAEPGGAYDGRRTGSTVVYEPDGLYTVSTSDGQPVVVVSRGRHVAAYDPWTGQRRWERSPPGGPSCHRDWTGIGTYLSLDLCADPPALDIVDAGTGRSIDHWSAPAGADIRPWGCLLGRSQCQLLSVQPRGSFRVTPDGQVTAEPYSHVDNQVVAGDNVVEWVPAGYARALSRATGAQLWRTDIIGYVAVADASGVYVVNPDDSLVVLDPATGTRKERIYLRGVEEGGPYNGAWWVWHVYVRDGFVALERMRSENPRDPDTAYFFGKFPVVVVGAGDQGS
jgi:outer membrane protein assembly factor BamB